MSTEIDWAEYASTHLAGTGKTHMGSRESCQSLDCLPPSLPVREGDLVKVDMPYRDADVGEFRVTSVSNDDGTVTLTFERP